MERRHFLAAAGAAPAATLAPALEPGFTSLFDGKTLAGWNIEEGPDSAYFVSDGALCVADHANLPCWLRSEREYENFDLRGEFFVRGWTDSGIYLRAPRHGRPGACGLQVKVFHQKESQPKTNSVGALFPHIAPRLVNVQAGWNEFRLVLDGQRFQAWMNGAQIHDVDLSSHAELAARLRHGYIGIAGVSVPCRYRNLRVRELPARDTWTPLYTTESDFAKWAVSEGKPNPRALGAVLRMDGAGHLMFKEAQFRDFELEVYVRGAAQHNGGILFRSSGRGLAGEKHYEIQLHPVEEAHYPTGSLYNIQRASPARIEDGKWHLVQLWVKDRHARVRVNGDTVMDYEGLELLDPGYIELQAHRLGYWIEFKGVRLRAL